MLVAENFYSVDEIKYHIRQLIGLTELHAF